MGKSGSNHFREFGEHTLLKHLILRLPRSVGQASVLCWKEECPLGAQLPISASVVGRYDIVVGSDVGIDRLMTDLEDAPDAAANGHSPAIIVIGLPVGRDEGARG